MLHVPSMEGLELGSEARMPFGACRPVTMHLAAGDTKTRLLNEPSIARLCMRLLIASWPNRSIVPLVSRRAVLAGRGADCLALLRRLSAVLFVSRHNDAAEEPVALTADKRAAAWTSARCTCQARAGPTNTSSLTTRKSSNV